MKLKQRIVLSGIVGVVTLVAGFVFYYTQLRTYTKAAPGVPSVFFAVNPAISSSTGNFDLILKVNPNGASFNAFDLRVMYDPAKTGFQNESDLNANIVEINPNRVISSQSRIDAQTHKITVVGLREGGANFSGSSDIEIVKITMKLLPGAGLPVVFTWDNGTKLGADIQIERVNGSFPESAGGSSSSGDPNKPGSIFMSSDRTQYQVGDHLDLFAYISTEGEQVKTSDIYLPFNSASVDFQRVGGISANVEILPGTGFSQSDSVVALSGNVIRITLITPTSGGNPVPVAGNRLKVAKILFKTKRTGDISFTVDQTRSNLYTLLNRNILGQTPGYTITVEEESGGGGGGGSSSSSAPETVPSNGDLLNINSNIFDQSPFRYEQQIVLDKATYTLTASARTYISRGRGVLVTVACAEQNCGNGKTLNAIIAETQKFPVSSQYQEQTVTFDINDATKNKRYTVRIFAEDGSEADFDMVSLQNQWGGEQLQNEQFGSSEQTPFARKHPDLWDIDEAGRIYGTVDTSKGNQGALYINSVSRE